MTKASLGQKIKYFRIRSKLSQSQLEIDAELSFGTISRIENGQVNPTKESLLKIAEIFGLNNDELIYLIYPEKLFVNEMDIKKAIENVKSFIDTSKTPVYILDNLRRVVYAGEAVIRLFGVTDEIASGFFGTHILELIFNPNFPIRKLIPKTEFRKLGLSRIYAYQKDLGYLLDNHELDETLAKLGQLPNFKELWEEAKNIIIDPYSLEERSFGFEIAGKIYRFYFTNLPLEKDKRFEIIEYHKL